MIEVNFFSKVTFEDTSLNSVILSSSKGICISPEGYLSGVQDFVAFISLFNSDNTF